jgi:hypothetical protein
VAETIEPMAAQIDQQELARELVARARADGVQLIGEGGLLTGLTKSVLECAVEEEMSAHLGYDKHDPAGRNGGNSRNGHREKTVLTEIGPVNIEVPRDREGSFEPAIVRKRQRRLTGIDEIVLSLTARGLTTGEIAAHFAEVYGASVSKDTISRITDKVIEEMAEWRNRPLAASTRCCSSTRLSSKCATGRWSTGRSTWSSASPSTASGTSSGYGPATAARARSSGLPC